MPSWMRSGNVLVAILGLACACAGGSGGEGETGETDETAGETGEEGLPDIDPAICDAMEFENAVDEAACDEIYGRGVEPELADEIELCRRLYVDLTGALPTQAEFQTDCKGKSATKIVDSLMDRDGYVLLGQRIWADTLLMTSAVTLFSYIVELDDLVGALYRGDILLPELAEVLSTHPGFTGRFDGQDLVGYSFQAFLGRDAAPHERVGLEPLWHLWEERYEEQHPDYYFGYTRAVVNTILCMGSSEGACHSSLWGHQSVVVPVVEEDDYDYEGVNVLAEEDLTSGQWNTLRLPGRLIAQQPTFYESAADQSLHRYLGYEAGSQLPWVRQRLVDMLQESGGDLREIEREILTSRLYRFASAYAEPEGTPLEEGDPDFWHGPMKQLTAEAWLDSAEKLTGVEIGSCDHRFTEVMAGRPLPDSPYEDTWWHPSTFPLDPEWPAAQNKPDYGYRDRARQLGGCPDQQGQLRYTGTGVMISIGYSAIGGSLCELAEPGSPMQPEGLAGLGKSEDELRGLVEDLYEASLTRPPAAELDEALGAAITSCRDSVDCDPATFARETCTTLLQSAPFVFY